MAEDQREAEPKAMRMAVVQDTWEEDGPGDHPGNKPGDKPGDGPGPDTAAKYRAHLALTGERVLLKRPDRLPDFMPGVMRRDESLWVLESARSMTERTRVLVETDEEEGQDNDIQRVIVRQGTLSAYRELPISMYLRCQCQHEITWFGRVFASLYECPSGTCRQDVLDILEMIERKPRLCTINS